MNRLRGSRVYLAGAIDRSPDNGVTWRHEITPLLREIGIVSINPCDKPIIGNNETPEFAAENRFWQKAGEFDKIIERRQTRNEDLRLIDVCAEFLIVNLNMDHRPFGTIEEIVMANSQKKPILVWMHGGIKECPIWLLWMLGSVETIFSSRDELLQYIRDIDSGRKNNKRFIFLDHSKLI